MDKETSARREWDRAATHLRAAETIGARLLIPEDEDWPVGPFLALRPVRPSWRACQRRPPRMTWGRKVPESVPQGSVVALEELPLGSW